jgi:hypothetical protein
MKNVSMEIVNMNKYEHWNMVISVDTNHQITSFSVDPNNELYIYAPDVVIYKLIVF